MSMPCFPDGTDLSREEAINMIIASIAMEEAGLSHIINAEGEKLQYVLGTLPGRHGACPTTQEVLEVNRSVTALLDSVMQNQMVLKWKLDKVLSAIPPIPPPCNPCWPPCSPCNPGCPCTPQTPQCHPDSILLTGPSGGYRWNPGCRLPWRCADPCRKSNSILWEPCDPTIVRLCSGRRYWLGFTLNVRVEDPCAKTVSVTLQTIENNLYRDLFPYHFHTGEYYAAQTLSGGTVLPTEFSGCGPFPVALALNASGCVQLEQAVFSIVEL